MKNKGYTIMEAVIAMFLVVVMVGAVFSALMSGRRAIVTSSEREEVFYSLSSAYNMIKDCRSNHNCHLRHLGCNYSYQSVNNQGLIECNDLFTFSFANVCKGANQYSRVGTFQFKVSSTTTAPTAWFYTDSNVCPNIAKPLPDFYYLNIEANCTEQE